MSQFIPQWILRLETFKMIFLLGLMAAAVATMSQHHNHSPLNMVLPPYGYNDMQSHRKIYDVSLSPTGDIRMQWWLDYMKNIVSFKIYIDENVKYNWFAFGFSDYGEEKFADYCIIRRFFDVGIIQDYHADENGIITLDDRQDCLDFYFDSEKGIIEFSRLFDTCDDDDYIIEEGTTHILWAIGEEFCGPQPVSSATKKGMIRTQLLKNEHAVPEGLDNVIPMDFTVDKVAVPASDTTYYCHVQRLPDWIVKRKYHIIAYEALITKGNEGLVHHMEIFYCDAPVNHVVDLYNGPCNDKPESAMVCKKVRAAWAMGAAPFYYPKEAGLSIGGPKMNPYIMIEIHYNNPEMRNDWIDSSGVRLKLTPNLRKYDASIIELGLEYTDKMIIPPKQPSFSLSGYCTAACTKVGLDEGGIIVFGSQLHTHTTGTDVETRHYRNGNELPLLNFDRHYSTHFQEIRILKKFVHVKPGDFLVTTCKYDTSNRTNITFGGYSIQEEMCVNYIHYYPSSDLEVCKSSIGTESLKSYFQFQKDFYNAKITDDMNVREKYNAVPYWNKMEVDTLNMAYTTKPIAMQCNSSNGDRFPGIWDPSDIDVILTRLPTPPRKCPLRN